ncbi:MAG TPA: LytR C-terminal domain-containing protein [Candidatus Limnocylindrales bacterium]|nr:LytR C-terminal domain-containing protein [Candidatus Limnocylindrales bacterium]
MQTKKRAKPVRFGSTGKEEHKTQHVSHDEVKPTDEEESVASSEKDISTEKDSNQPASDSKHTTHGLEAHITSTTQTIDIKEISDDSPPEELEDKSVINDEPQESADEAEEVKTSETKDAQSDESAEVSEVVGDGVSQSEAESVEENDEVEELTSEKDEIAEEQPVEDKKDFFNAPPDDYDKKKSMFPYFIRVLIITFIVGLVFFAGVYYAVTNKAVLFPSSKKPVAEVTDAPVVMEPTKKPVDLALYSIQVLNGTSTSGVAAKAREQLTAEGFKVSSVGNAKTNDFEKTQISASDKVSKDYLDKLNEVLSRTYTVGTVNKVASGSSDVIVTIGSATAK